MLRKYEDFNSLVTNCHYDSVDLTSLYFILK